MTQCCHPKADRESLCPRRRPAGVSDGRLVVSSIYEWYNSDFGDGDEGVIRHLRKYAGPELASALYGVKRLADNHYEWSLNDAKE